ncbi:uncharacterized protein PFL1_06492 [Pseudozyma flocculosa PF-1]|uniref:Cyclase n=2 Tax=Pseudozyma flocculosa TaxID=84751 RepID=A0A5C3EUD4_9BASI|nr:uncharacterized protein PFL1_06492 [Pseudozyma flocculosa PF-1]EPQ26039.1 hypothetical protein PFL1_06492 [Pseudozyma flocculosa PF-1]SPO35652.1 uncharacterized protein PSFLO_01123 [Pseudozyma flocculosa]
MKTDDNEELSKRKRIKELIGRAFSSHSYHHEQHKPAQTHGDNPHSASAPANAVTSAASVTARQSASILSAMAASGKDAVEAISASSGDASHDDERHHYESPLRARRRLAAIATQLGLATSTATQSSTSSHYASVSQSTHAEDKSKWNHLPRYKDLPSEGGYPGCAWSVWGEGDQLGTTNLLTDAVVARSARDEVRTGTRISLNWPLHLPQDPFFKRQAVHHEIKGKGGEYYTKPRDAAVEDLRKQGKDVVNRGEDSVPVTDDTLHLNTQSGSQWDGLRHMGHMPLNCFYGGVDRKTLQDTFANREPQGATPEQLNSEESRQRNQLGIHHLAERGVCGRGVLLDVFAYLSSKPGGHERWKEYAYDPSKTYFITVDDLKETAKAQGVTFRKGDILLVRSGFTVRYYDSTPEERKEWVQRLTFAGVDQSEEMKAFLWDNHFAAVAGDAPAFEARPSLPKHAMLHETLLGLWGMPIGEMFDLEALAQHAAQHRRWTFFFSSWPLNLYGGVASTANAAAIF